MTGFFCPVPSAGSPQVALAVGNYRIEVLSLSQHVVDVGAELYEPTVGRLPGYPLEYILVALDWILNRKILNLKKHTPAQVVAGALVGSLLPMLVFWCSDCSERRGL
jgi:hypothetical protein